MHELFRNAANSMMYMILQGAKNNDYSFAEELMSWMESFDETTDPAVLAVLAEDVEVELREGWSYTSYGHPDFLAKLAAYIGEGYEEVIFYHIVKRAVIKIKEEDSDEYDTNGGQDK